MINRQTKRKILIVDEDTNYITGLRKGLSQVGYEVIYWDDGKKALEVAKNLQPDLIIVEVELSQINGYEFFKEIKSIPELRNAPLIFLSSQKRVDERIKSMELGVEDFITKPFYVEEVVARIESLLKEVTLNRDNTLPSEKGFSGNLVEMNLIDLIQTLEVGNKSGIINLKYNSFEGKVYVLDGKVINAAFRDFTPREALMKMFLWFDGFFWVEITPVNQQTTITDTNQELISEGLQLMNQWQVLIKDLPPLNSVVTINQINFDKNNISEEEQLLLSSLNGNQIIYEVLLNSPFDDIMALKMIHQLFQKGYLQETGNYQSTLPEQDTKSNFIKSSKDNHHAAQILSNLLIKMEEGKQVKLERRRDERRQQPERRRAERRKDRRITGHKIYLDKTELLMIREKLL